MATWDHSSAAGLTRLRNAAVRTQFSHAIGPYSPYWSERLVASGVEASRVRTAADLDRLPAVGEADLCPDGDAAGMARLVLTPPDRWAVHAGGLALRRAMWRRIFDRGAYRTAVDVDTRPTTFLVAGLGLRYLLACTRGDLDLMARAGARLFAVLGITRADCLFVCLPPRPTVENRGLQLAALATGVPAVAPGPRVGAVAEALRLVPATVLAAPSARFADLVEELASAGADLTSVRLGLLVGAPAADDRLAAEQALADNGREGATVLAVHAPAGARVLWGECPQAPESQRGLHTYPDLEVVQLCDPDTGHAYAGEGPAEPVLTQLGFRGSALVRWRTGDVVAGPLDTAHCPGCRRSVPRIPSQGIRVGGLVAPLADTDGAVGRLDLRALGVAVAGHDGVADWAVAVGPRSRDASPSVVLHLCVSAEGGPPGEDRLADVALAVAQTVGERAGMVPTQIVAGPAGQFAFPAGEPVTAHIVIRAGG